MHMGQINEKEMISKENIASSSEIKKTFKWYITV